VPLEGAGEVVAGELAAPVHVHAAAGPSEPPELAALMAEAAETAETALDVVTAAETAAAQLGRISSHSQTVR
jgi:hypothetical protein